MNSWKKLLRFKRDPDKFSRFFTKNRRASEAAYPPHFSSETSRTSITDIRLDRANAVLIGLTCKSECIDITPAVGAFGARFGNLLGCRVNPGLGTTARIPWGPGQGNTVRPRRYPRALDTLPRLSSFSILRSRFHRLRYGRNWNDCRQEHN